MAGTAAQGCLVSEATYQGNQPLYSAIHKAAGSLVTGHSLQNGKMSMGNRRTERPLEVVLYGGKQSGGFVNSAVSATAINLTTWEICYLKGIFEKLHCILSWTFLGTLEETDDWITGIHPRPE